MAKPITLEQILTYWQSLAKIDVKPFKEWHEDFGPCVFYLPITNEPPRAYCGTPLDHDWPWEDVEILCFWHPVPKRIDKLSREVLYG